MKTVEHFDEFIEISLSVAMDEESLVLDMIMADLLRQLKAVLLDNAEVEDREILTIHLIATERYDEEEGEGKQ